MNPSARVAGSGPDVILLHGWGMHAGAWDGVVARLTRRFRVQAVDLPGHGHAAAELAADVADLVVRLAARAPARILLAGWSLGGQVAMAWAAARPGQIAGLVLVATTPRFVAGPDWPHGLPAADVERFERGVAADPAGTLARFHALQAAGATRSRAALAAVREVAARAPAPTPAALAQGMRWLRTLDLRAALTPLDAPVRVVHGECDRVVPPGAGEFLAHALGRGPLRLLPGAGHACPISHPDAVAQAICGAADD